MRTIVVVWIICLLYVLFQGGKTSIMLFTMFTILSIYWILSSFAGMKQIKGKRFIASDRERNGQLKAGDHLIVRLHLNLPKFMPLPYIVVKEQLQRHTGESWQFEDSVVLLKKDQKELLFQTPPLERGKYDFTGTECHSEDIFGLVKHKGIFLVESEFHILPRTVFIPKWDLHGRNSLLAGPETANSLSRRETTQINGVRDYVYGDRFSRIHWAATAKSGTWKSKQFEHESLQKTVIILDASQASYASASTFELAVSTVSSILEYGARQKMSMGLCTLGRSFCGFTPDDSFIKRQQMLHHLVDIHADGQGQHKQQLEANLDFLPQGSFFIFISPLADDQVVTLMRWAKARRMVPYHIWVGEHTRQAANAAQWRMTMRELNMLGAAVPMLTDLPSALGGGTA